jgi:protein involved in polysaccharide export with SLBB domain
VKSGELNQVVEQGVRKTFKSNTRVYAALDVSQPVKVYVTGFVRQPGLYNGVAADSPLSYLDKAGGVDQDRGSYVDIVIKRGEQIRKRVNLYNFLLNGTLDLVQFQDGDVILVGPRQHTFSVAGEAFNAYDFEFGEPTIPLQRALDMAKVKPGATHVSIVRRQGIERTTEYYPLRDTAKVTINDGDNVTVTTDRYPGTIQVRIEGAHSGEHAMVLPYGATLKDVLARIKTNPMSRMDAIQIYRKSVADRQREMLLVSLQKLEEATLSARSASVEEAGLRAKESDSIMRFVERAKNLQPKGQIILSEVERDGTLLQDGDQIMIPERTSLVMVHGEVLFPNAVSWQRDLVPDGYIKKAGGFTQGADTSRVLVIRQNGATMLAENADKITAGDEIIVLPKIETKSIEVARSLTQIIYQIAFSVGVIFGIFNN